MKIFTEFTEKNAETRLAINERRTNSKTKRRERENS